MSGNLERVERFLRAWEARDVDAIMSFFSDDAVYINVPLEPIHRGRAAIRAAVEGFVAMGDAIEFVVHHSAEDAASGVVLTERTDRFRIGGEWLEAPVAGIFELREGRIVAWRDYFDASEFERFAAQAARRT